MDSFKQELALLDNDWRCESNLCISDGLHIIISIKGEERYIWLKWLDTILDHLQNPIMVTLQSLITPKHGWCHSKIRSELNSCWSHMLKIWQIIRNVPISNNGYVNQMVHINENRYVDSSSVLSFFQLGMYSVDLYFSDGLYIHYPGLIKCEWKLSVVHLQLICLQYHLPSSYVYGSV